MSVSIHVEGFVEPDEEFKKKLTAYRALVAAGEPIPDSLDKYFNYKTPDDNGLSTDIPAKDWSDNYREGYEIRLSDIPSNVKVVRFYMSA